jgi:hypothetical protein
LACPAAGVDSLAGLDAAARLAGPAGSWQLWVSDAADGLSLAADSRADGFERPGGRHAKGGASQEGGVPVVPATAVIAGPVAVIPVPAKDVPAAGWQEKVGIFGAQKRAEALLSENAGLVRENERLRQQVSALLGMSISQVAAEADRTRAEIQSGIGQAKADLATVSRQVLEARQQRDAAMADAASTASQLQQIRAQIVATDELSALQEAASMSTGTRCRTRSPTRAAWQMSKTSRRP